MASKYLKLILSTMVLAFSCTIAGYGEASQDIAHVPKMSKPNQLEDYTEIYADNLVFNIPSYLVEDMGYVTYFHLEGYQPVSMWDHVPSNPSAWENKFQSEKDKSLESPRLHLKDPVGEALPSQIKQPGFLEKTVCETIADKILKDVPDEDEILKLHFPSKFSAYLKLTQGYLEFYMPCDYFDMSSDGEKGYFSYNQEKIKQIENDRKNSFFTSIENFMMHYKWVGEGRVEIGQGYRTRFGLISQDGLYMKPKFNITFDSNEDAQRVLGAISTNDRDEIKEWQEFSINHFMPYDGKQAGETTFAFPRLVGGRWGMQGAIYNSDTFPLILWWVESPFMAPQNHEPLLILLYFAEPPPHTGLQFDSHYAQKLWNNILDNIEVMP